MKKSQFTEEQIAYALHEVEVGTPVAEICRKCSAPQNWFASLDDARTIIETWRQDYNTVRPHTALDQLTPAAYKEHWFQQQRLSENR